MGTEVISLVRVGEVQKGGQCLTDLTKFRYKKYFWVTQKIDETVELLENCLIKTRGSRPLRVGYALRDKY